MPHRYIEMLKISLNSRFFIPNMTYYKKNEFHLSVGPFFKFLDTKSQIGKKMLKMKKNTFPKIVSEIVSQLKKYPMHCQLQNSLYPSVQFLINCLWWEVGGGCYVRGVVGVWGRFQLGWGGVQWVCK